MRSTECNLRQTIGSSGRIVPVRHRSMHAKENRSGNIGPPTNLPCAMPPSMNQSESVDAM